MTEHRILDLAGRLWPDARDTGRVGEPGDLDILLAAQGQPGAVAWSGGIRDTFACFAPDEEAALTLPTGERTQGDEEARFIAHLLVTRVLLGAGLAVDPRVQRAMAAAHALSWAAEGGRYHQTPLALAVSLWLVALDPQSSSDRPLEIDWEAEYFDDPERWDPEYRLVSHYDIRERAVDWATYVSNDPERYAGCSVYTIVAPLLRMEDDARVRLALAQLAASPDQATEGVPAAAMLERGRIAGHLQAYVASVQRGASGRGIRFE